MGISDLIAAFIQQELEEADGVLELRRSDLATRFNCVPSQINYVISSRFTPEQGYRIESRRGGGGCIKITRVTFADSRQMQLMHVVNCIGDSLTQFDAFLFLRNLSDYGVIGEEKNRLIRTAVSDNTLSLVPFEIRDRVRASIIKALLMTE